MSIVLLQYLKFEIIWCVDIFVFLYLKICMFQYLVSHFWRWLTNCHKNNMLKSNEKVSPTVQIYLDNFFLYISRNKIFKVWKLKIHTFHYFLISPLQEYFRLSYIITVWYQSNIVLSSHCTAPPDHLCNTCALYYKLIHSVFFLKLCMTYFKSKCQWCWQVLDCDWKQGTCAYFWLWP